MARSSSLRFTQEHILECVLILVCLGLATLLHVVDGYKPVVLNLFYLPVVLAAFYLGRSRAATLALFCVLVAIVVAVIDLPSFAGTTPLITALSLTVWAAVMGLNAIIVGTLSDERSSKMAELHDAHLGVVEVLAHYLSSADSEMNQRASRVATLSQSVARQMRLSDQEVDDIRVAAVLRDLNNIEITAHVMQRAIGDLSEDNLAEPHTFRGSELVQALGAALTTSLPLIVGQAEGVAARISNRGEAKVPFGAAIIHAVYRFDSLIYGRREPFSAGQALYQMQSELDGDYHPAVIHALGQVILDLPERATERLETLANLVRSEC